jgi:hypothetical protein
LGRAIRSAAIIGVGGGEDLLPALAREVKEIDAYELNQIIIDLLEHSYRGFFAVVADPAIRLHHAEARVGIQESGKKYDLIVASLIDTWAATASGGMVLSESGLYTVEAWQAFLQALSAQGMLTMTRWLLPQAPAEAARLLSLAVTALEASGVRTPLSHLIMVAHRTSSLTDRFTSDGEAKKITIIVSKSPFSRAELDSLDRLATVEDFDVLLAATRGATPEWATSLLDPTARADAIEQSDYDISPPTDLRPFFFLQMRPRDILEFRERRFGDVTQITYKGVLVLGTLVVLSALLAGCVIVAAWWKRPTARLTTSERKRFRWMILYFCGIGFGYMSIQLGLHQRLILILGHPTLALSVILFWMLLGTGLGARTAEMLNSRRRMIAAWCTITVVLTVLLLGYPALGALDGRLSSPLRSGVIGLIVTATGLVLGFAFPIGVRIASSSGEWAIQQLWAVNAAGSITGSALAALIGLMHGSRAMVAAGLAAYVGVLAAGILASREWAEANPRQARSRKPVVSNA